MKSKHRFSVEVKHESIAYKYQSVPIGFNKKKGCSKCSVQHYATIKVSLDGLNNYKRSTPECQFLDLLRTSKHLLNKCVNNKKNLTFDIKKKEVAPRIKGNENEVPNFFCTYLVTEEYFVISYRAPPPQKKKDI